MQTTLNVTSNEDVIAHTKKWIHDVVIACNFCPFAAKEIKRGTVSFKVIQQADRKKILETIAHCFQELNTNVNVETILVIVPDRFTDFVAYLDLLDTVQSFLEAEGHEGVYQLASFHPAYVFAGTAADDPSNFTNRSPHPIVQILREASISKAVESFKNIEDIPTRNVAFAKQLGLERMINLRASCFDV